jgi:hypothetical protein
VLVWCVLEHYIRWIGAVWVVYGCAMICVIWGCAKWVCVGVKDFNFGAGVSGERLFSAGHQIW